MQQDHFTVAIHERVLQLQLYLKHHSARRYHEGCQILYSVHLESTPNAWTACGLI